MFPISCYLYRVYQGASGLKGMGQGKKQLEAGLTIEKFHYLTYQIPR